MTGHATAPMAVPATTPAAHALVLHVHAKHVEAEGVVSLDLRARDGASLPPFEAGAHIDVHIPASTCAGGSAAPLVRQYSLCNAPSERHRYVVGIGRDPASRGGSAYLHDKLDEGDEVCVGRPQNHFRLNEVADHSVLLAGGIGITPLLCMARRLGALGRSWTLYYCVRTPERAAFLAEAQAIPGGQVISVFNGVPGGLPIDIGAVVNAASGTTHLYCCGPASLMQAFEKAAAARDPHTVHIEWFSARQATVPATAGAGDHPFDLILARTGKTIPVPADKSILDMLIIAGVAPPHSCLDGVCGTCETRVLAGQPVHRDSVLLGADANATDRIMVCVSRCAGATLTLDL